MEKNVEYKVPDNFKTIGPRHNSKDEEKPYKEYNVMNMNVLVVECPTILKKH